MEEAAMGTLPTDLAVTGGQLTSLAASGGSIGRPAHRFGCQWRQPGQLYRPLWPSLEATILLWLPVEAAMGDQPTRSLAVTRGSIGRPAHRFGCQWRQHWATSPPLWLPVEAAMGTLPDRSRCQWRQPWATSPPLWLPVEAARDTLPTALAVTGGQLTALAASGGSHGRPA